MVTENSYYNRITSMSCLKKLIDTVEMECGKSFINVVLWSDGIGAQFWSRFTFQLLAGTIFLNKSLCWFYNERHHGKVSMGDFIWTSKKRHLPKSKVRPNFLMLPRNLCHLSLLCNCLDRMKQFSLKASIRHHPSPKHFQPTNLFDRSLTEEIAV